MRSSHMFSFPKQDLVAGTVVFLIALPLCLGIAIACGVPPLSGLLAGVIGGLVVPWISRSPLSVAGPAAGLTSIVLMEVDRLGGVGPFFTAVIIAGVLQFLFGVLKLGRFSALVPASVVKGMLAAIGITIVLKQLPVSLGVKGGLADIPAQLHDGAAIITILSLVILYGWKKTPLARVQFIPAALVVVLLGGVLARMLEGTSLALAQNQFVSVPLGGVGELFSALPRPDYSILQSSAVWVAGITIAVVASIETLLSTQAVDRLDPWKRHSPPDRELIAQGVANTLSGVLGGLPLTAVIVRSGANVSAGGRERLSTLVHGLWILLAVVFMGPLLNQIPLACLAAVLIQVGLNLSKPALYMEQRRLGVTQFLPFIVTIVAVLTTDLLKGVIVGIVIGVILVLNQYVRGAIVQSTESDGVIRIRLRRDATFLVKPALVTALDNLDDGVRVVIDGSAEYVDQDVKEVLVAFVEDAHTRQIDVRIVGIDLAGASAGGH